MSDILITDELKNEIKKSISIVDLIGQYVTLRPESNFYRGLCPFHNENTPSFVVYPPNDKNDHGTFYCYGCHAGNLEETGIANDIIGFIMAIEKVDFIQACKMLCDKYSIPYQTKHVDPESSRLKQAMTQKNVEYHNYLKQNALVLNYLKDRGVNSESLVKFRLGLVPSNEGVEWKRNRLVFGITDTNYEPTKASTIAMGYRCLQGEIKAPDGAEYFPNTDIKSKYRNDAESKIFKKSRVLFGLNHAIKPIRKMGFAIVVEGYMDVILMHQAGFENTIAPMGTSFTDEQMDLLKKYTTQLLFFMDADERGLDSMRKVLPRLLERGFSVLVVEAPANLDPADLVNNLGQDHNKMANYIRQHSTPALQWCTNTAILQYEAKVHKAKIDALKTVLPILDKVNHRESRIAYTSSIADKLGVDANLLLEKSLITNDPSLDKPVTDGAGQNLPSWAKHS